MTLSSDTHQTEVASELLKALERAVSALNMPVAFRTNEGISSYTLISQLEAVLKKAREQLQM